MDQSFSKENTEDLLVFADEDEDRAGIEMSVGSAGLLPWKILIVDDEEDVHEITRITLRGFSFEDRGLELISAYSEQDVKNLLNSDTDIALVLLDVVMEREDSGLRLVEYIRNELNNSSIRIVLRTGQPGKAPEQEVITKYDINDYKTKPDLTAQKLFTMITACLRAYGSLKTIEQNTIGLENIIQAASRVFKHLSFAEIGAHVLENMLKILDLSSGTGNLESAYFIGMPGAEAKLMAGIGQMEEKQGGVVDDAMPQSIPLAYKKYKETGGEYIKGDDYVGVFRTREGFSSILYLSGWNTLTETQKNLLRIYINNIAIGFENISLTREIINTQKEVIFTLGEIVETRSQETANHVARVAEVCYLLALKYDMDKETCELLRLASPMHDVGKIGIPEVILNKPGKLTDKEFDVIKEHARIGYDILRKSNRSIMKAASIIALQHHERWDGNGYPQGLPGEKIHIYGRIAAIADVFDALSHKRCYKDAWEMDRIIELFRNESGKHFDARLVNLLIENIDEFEDINNRFPE